MSMNQCARAHILHRLLLDLSLQGHLLGYCIILPKAAAPIE